MDSRLQTKVLKITIVFNFVLIHILKLIKITFIEP